MRPSKRSALSEHTGPLLLELTLLATVASATPVAMAFFSGCKYLPESPSLFQLRTIPHSFHLKLL